MKFAVIQTGGKQYVAQIGDILKIEKIIPEEGKTLAVEDKVTFEEVLLIDEDGETKLGTPFIPGSSVGGVLMEIGRSRKVITRKYKAKARYRNVKGHRQPFMKVRIESIK